MWGRAVLFVVVRVCCPLGRWAGITDGRRHRPPRMMATNGARRSLLPSWMTLMGAWSAAGGDGGLRRSRPEPTPPAGSGGAIPSWTLRWAR